MPRLSRSISSSALKVEDTVEAIRARLGSSFLDLDHAMKFSSELEIVLHRTSIGYNCLNRSSILQVAVCKISVGWC